MRYLITAGGTREPIDAVRVVANRRTGRLGALLADQAAAAGHDVTLLHAVDGARPAADGIAPLTGLPLAAAGIYIWHRLDTAVTNRTCVVPATVRNALLLTALLALIALLEIAFA